MRYIIVILLITQIYSTGTGQTCLGPLSISLEGNDTGIPLGINYIHSNIYCEGSDSGAIEVQPYGGTPGYQIEWEQGNTEVGLFNLSPGMYAVTVTDATDCTKVANIEIGVVDPTFPNIIMAMDQGCGTCILDDGTSTYIFLGADYMVEVTDIPDDRNLDGVEVCIDMAPQHMFFESKPLMKRSWTIQSTSNKASMKLFFAESELMDWIYKAGYEEVTQAVPSKVSINKFDGGDMRPDNYEVMTQQHNVTLKRFNEEDEVWYVDVPNILFEEDKPTTLYLELIPTLLSSTEDENETEFGADNNIDLDFYIFTNPVSDFVELRTDVEEHLGIGEITIYNRIGQEMQIDGFNKEILDGYRFDVTHFSAGVYLMVIRYNDREFVQTLKFVKV